VAATRDGCEGRAGRVADPYSLKAAEDLVFSKSHSARFQEIGDMEGALSFAACYSYY
jgi:hypothetical protein